MSVKSLLQLLKKGEVEKFNKQRPQVLDLFAADLSKANLPGVNLSNVNLEKADLSNTNLEGADLTKTKVMGADFTKANLKSIFAPNSKWDEAYIGDADLSDADLSGASMNNIEAPNANFERAILENTYMKNADLEKCNFHDAELLKTRLTSSNAEKANFSNAIMNGAKLAKAKLSKCNFESSKMTGALLAEAELINANFQNAILNSANLDQANLKGAKLKNCSMIRADVTGVDVSKVNFRSAITDEIAADLGVFPQKPTPMAPHVFIEDPQIAFHKTNIAVVWINHESPKKQLRVIRAKIGGKQNPDIVAIPTPVDLLIAYSIINTPEGFVIMCIEERPSGRFALFYKIPLRGKTKAFCRIRLKYTTSSFKNTAFPNFKLCPHSQGVVLYVIARNYPKIRSHVIRFTGEHYPNAYDLPTINGLIGKNKAIALTKGGTLAVLAPSRPIDMLSCPQGFPGKMCDVDFLEDVATVAWVHTQNIDDVPKLGVYVCSLDEKSSPARLHRKSRIQTICLGRDKNDVWITYILLPIGFDPPEVWTSQTVGFANYQLNLDTDEDLEQLTSFSSDKKSYVGATSLSGVLLIYELGKKGAKQTNVIR